MRLSVFEHNDYKSFLREVIAVEDSRGYVRQLAEAASCQRSYLSSVLHSHNHLTPDQAYGLASYWKMSAREEDYFLLLVDLERSGTQQLRQRLRRKLTFLKNENENLSKRLDRPALPSKPDETLYYSSWIWSAIHIIVSIPNFRTPQEIAVKLGLSESYVQNSLETLEKMQLVKSSKRHWEHGSGSIHISRDSPLVTLHHNQWRQLAILHAQTRPAEGTHFTTVTALSQEARQNIKELILKLIDDFASIAGPSSSEELVCMNLDFFEVGVK